VQSILDALKADYPAVVEEVRKALGIGEIQKVLQGLLTERVSVRNMVVILETLADYGTVTKDIGFLIEKVRQALGRQICLQYCDENKVLRVLTIEPSLEKKIIDSRLETNRGIVAGLDPALHRKWISALTNAVKAVQEQGLHEVILCSEAARPLVKSGTGREIPHLAVISSLEVASDVTVEALGEIRIEG
jgi:flagellar biosynthesis protein FlhA